MILQIEHSFGVVSERLYIANYHLVKLNVFKLKMCLSIQRNRYMDGVEMKSCGC